MQVLQSTNPKNLCANAYYVGFANIRQNFCLYFFAQKFQLAKNGVYFLLVLANSIYHFSLFSLNIFSILHLHCSVRFGFPFAHTTCSRIVLFLHLVRRMNGAITLVFTIVSVYNLIMDACKSSHNYI